MRKKDTRTLFTAGMLLSFIGVTLCSMIYMAKDNNYDNTIYQYFNISKHVYSRLIYLKIHKDTLVNSMNACSLLFIICNYFLSHNAMHPPKALHRRLLPLLLLFWTVQAVAYHTAFYRAVYEGSFGFLPDPVTFRAFYLILQQITGAGNLLTLLMSVLYLLSSAFKKEPVKELRYIKWSLTVIHMCICLLYLYMYDSLPAAFLWISRSVGYTGYESLKMRDYISFMRIIPYLTIIFILVLWYNLYRYDRMLRRMKDEEFVFSSIAASSEISVRAFSHYVKNELLSVIAETELMMQDSERVGTGLENIRGNCLNVYERLDSLQRNANRIVLNQSLHNVIDILEKSLEDNEEYFKQNNVTADYVPDCREARVFCDPHYMSEVFRNIYSNAIDAMNASHDTHKVITVQTTRYENQIRIQIGDSGPGISPSVAGSLFEPFISTKSTKYNWGIGLSFVKRIINCHMGKIEAGSRAGGGAVFTIHLPVSEY